ncbi:hypothetical protein [Actinoplanes rectilineatus]|uniref:hypothetical protein n=1 Tax=Actinoplanes rectilineatus TaxID=113571 RepID=UPI0005F2C8BE|nr:hypothetical protein [Actinoplanes rectilineatus]
MADYAADAPSSAGVAIVQRNGTASADTVPAGCTLLVFNSGAGVHNVDLAIGYLFDGLPVGSAATPGKRRYAIAASTYQLVRVPANYGDANGRVGLTIDGTATEIKYWVIGA